MRNQVIILGIFCGGDVRNREFAMTESVIVRMHTSLAGGGRASHFVGRGGWDALRPKRSGTAVPHRSCAHGASASARTYCGSLQNCDRAL